MDTCQMCDSSMQMKLYQYRITGRRIPTEAKPNPEAYRMTLFARDEVVAKSQFWKFMKTLKRCKKSHGELLEIKRIYDADRVTVKNYAMWIRYNSKTKVHNMYKEYRDVTIEGAVSTMLRDMAGRYRASPKDVTLMKFAVISDEQCRRPATIQLHGQDFKFPQIVPGHITNREDRKLFVSKQELRNQF